MTQINLLPWREQRREQEKKRFTIILFVGVVFAAFIVFIMSHYVANLISNQIARNQMLQSEIESLNIQIKEMKTLKQRRAALSSRMSIIHSLQSTRALMVHLFDELINILPLGTYVFKLERKKNKVILWGYSESNLKVSILMRNIENNAWMQNPRLIEIKNRDNGRQPATNEFKLSFILKSKYQAESL